MKMKIMIIMLLSAVVLTAQPGRTRGFYGWSDQLNLTTEQIQQINELRTQYMKNRMGSQTEVASLRLDLRQLMIADNPSQRKIDAKLKNIQAKEAVLEQLWVQHRLSIRSQLTEEQRIHFDNKSMMGRGIYARNGGSSPGFGACDGSGPHGRRGNMGW
jgi:Spy/CpxP family protein refolding chaperone